MAEPRTRLIFSEVAERMHKQRGGMPEVFGRKARTEFIVSLAVNGPMRTWAGPNALGMAEMPALKMFRSLEKDRIGIKQFNAEYETSRKHRIALDPRHPAAKEIAALAFRLDELFPVERIEQKPGAWISIPTEPPYDPKDIGLPRILHTVGRTEAILVIAAAGEIQRGAITKMLGKNQQRGERDMPKLEVLGILRSRRVGQRVMVSLNPDLVVYKELRALLDRLLDIYPKYREAAARYFELRDSATPISIRPKIHGR